jgi:hypothetical protein
MVYRVLEKAQQLLNKLILEKNKGNLFFTYIH